MAKEAKRSFVLYYDYREHIALLTDEERGRLFMALLDYGETGEEPELEGAALMAFSFIRSQLDRDAARYNEKCRKRSEAGKLGGRPPKASESTENQEEAKKANAFSEKQSEAKKADNDTDNDNDTDTDTDTDKLSKDNLVYTPPNGGESPAPPPPSPPPDTTPYMDIVGMYHSICVSYPKLRSVSVQRKRAIAARWREYEHNLDIFRELFQRAEQSPFLKGRNKKNWAADFNWLMNAENMAKVLEGNYDDNTTGGQANGQHSGHSGGQERPTGIDTGGATLTGFRMAE